MKTSPLQLLRYLFLLTAATLAVLGMVTFVRIGAAPQLAAVYAFYALLMFIDAAIMLFCAFQIHKKKKNIYRLAVIILALNILLTIFDQFGLPDLLFLLLNLVTLIILFIGRKETNPA